MIPGRSWPASLTVVGLACLLATTAPAWAEAGGDVGVRGGEALDELLALAETSSPALRAARDAWSAARERVPQASAWPDPTLSYGYFLEPVETRVGPQRQKIGLRQRIPFPGTRGLQGDRAEAQADAARAAYEAARRDLRYRVTLAWLDVVYLARATAVTEANVRLLTDLESVALSQYAAGRVPHASVIRAQVELGKLDDRLRSLRDQERSLLAAVNAELGRPADTPVAIPDSLPAPSLDPASIDVTRLDTHPDLVALRARVEAAEAGVGLARRRSFPDLMLGVEVIDIDEARMPDVEDSGKNAAMVTASIDLPIWIGRDRAARSEAAARRSTARHELSQRHARLVADFERITYAYRDADRRVDLYAHTLLPRARQSMEVTEEAFTSGRADFLSLVDAQRTLLAFELEHESARFDRVRRLAELERLLGPERTDSHE